MSGNPSGGERERFEVPARPVTTGAGGGLPPKIVALGVAGVLIVVATIAIAGRREPPAGADSLALTRPSVEPTRTPTAEQAPTPPATPAPSGTPLPSAAPSVRYVAIGTVGSESLRAELIEVRPGFLAGQYWLSDPPIDDQLAFEIIEVKVGPRKYARGETVGAWELSLAELAGNHRSGLEPVAAGAPARPILSGAPRPIRRGYELRVSVRLAFDEVVVVYIDMELGNGRRRLGEDGLFDRRIWGGSEPESPSVTR